MWGSNGQQGGSAPVIVQGVAVPSYGGNKYDGQTSSPYGAHSQPMGNFNGYKGEQQPKQYQDVTFSAIFFVHLLVMILLGVIYGPSMVQGGNYNGIDQLVFVVSFCGFIAIGFSAVSLGG